LARRSGKFKKRGRNDFRKRPPTSCERTPMLNLNRVTTFRYDIREIMSHYEIDEAVASTVIASVIAKASRISIASAMSYVREQEEAGSVKKEVSEEICDLLDRWSRYR
jgi:hypothetical protein